MPKNQNFGSTERFTSVIQGIHNLADHPARHIGIDLSRKFNEARVQIILAGFPFEIKRINWNTMPAQTGSRVIGRKAKRFGRSGFITSWISIPIRFRYNLHFVDQSNIHGTVNILQQLRHLSSFGRRNWDGSVNCWRIERLGDL